MAVWRGPAGIMVEVIVLNRSPLYKVTQLIHGRRYLLDYAYDVAGVQQHVALEDLCEVIAFPVSRERPS